MQARLIVRVHENTVEPTAAVTGEVWRDEQPGGVALWQHQPVPTSGNDLYSPIERLSYVFVVGHFETVYRGDRRPVDKLHCRAALDLATLVSPGKHLLVVAQQRSGFETLCQNAKRNVSGDCLQNKVR
jgi:hypothetical protein